MASSSMMLASAIVVGNGISFLSLPLLSRIYTPEAFGVFGVVISWGTIASVFFTLRLESVVPITSSVTQAQSLARRAINRTWIMTIGLSSIVLFLLLFGSRLGHGIGPIELLLGVGTAFCGSYFALGRSLHQRLDDYRIIASSSIIRSFAFAGFSILLGVTGSYSSSAPLLFASMVAFLVPGLLLHMTLHNDMRKAMIPGPALMIEQTDYSEKALGRVTSSFILSQISFQFPLWIAMGCFGSAAAGWMTMGYRLVMFPSDIICGSISLVIARRVADSIFNYPQNLSTDKRLLAFFLLGNFLLFLLLGMCLLFLTGIVLGPEWEAAAPVIALLATVGLSFTVQPTVVQILSILNREREAFAVNVIHCVLLAIGAIVLFWLSSSLFQGVVGLAFVEILFSTFLSVYVIRAIRDRSESITRS